MITWLILTIWTLMSSVPKKADKLNFSLCLFVGWTLWKKNFSEILFIINTFQSRKCISTCLKNFSHFVSSLMVKIHTHILQPLLYLYVVTWNWTSFCMIIFLQIKLKVCYILEESPLWVFLWKWLCYNWTVLSTGSQFCSELQWLD